MVGAKLDFPDVVGKIQEKRQDPFPIFSHICLFDFLLGKTRDVRRLGLDLGQYPKRPKRGGKRRTEENVPRVFEQARTIAIWAHKRIYSAQRAGDRCVAKMAIAGDKAR